jgi:hypothetical protein
MLKRTIWHISVTFLGIFTLYLLHWATNVNFFSIQAFCSLFLLIWLPLIAWTLSAIRLSDRLKKAEDHGPIIRIQRIGGLMLFPLFGVLILSVSLVLYKNQIISYTGVFIARVLNILSWAAVTLWILWIDIKVIKDTDPIV